MAALLISCQPATQVTKGEEPSSQPAAEEASITDLSHLISSNPADIDNSNLPITPVEKLGTTGFGPREVDVTQYRLTVDGLVETPLTLTYEALRAYPAVTEVLLLICPDLFANNAEWTGVPVATLLAEAGIKPEASKVTFSAMDKYSQMLPLEEVQQEGVFLAYMVNGQILPSEHGNPIRLVVKGKYGSYWVKWLERIEVK